MIHFVNIFKLLMSKISSYIIISPSDALNLELVLNKSEYGKKWKELGDTLYKCRLDPRSYNVDQTDFKITAEQVYWIKNTIKLDSYKKIYKFFY